MRPQIVEVSSATTSTPIPVNRRASKWGLFFDLQGGTMTGTVEYTPDVPEDFTSATDWNTNANWRAVTGLDGVSADADGNIFFPVSGIRLDITAYTSGTGKLTILQADK